MARSRIYVGNPAANVSIQGASTLVERAVKHGTKAMRLPMEAAMREVYSGVKRDWPHPTASNRTGNKRRQGQTWGGSTWAGFNDIGWSSTGYSRKRWRWSTNVNVHKGEGKLIVALTNDATKKGARYAFMARFPYPSRKFYWREIALRPMRKKGKQLIKDLADSMADALGGR